MMSDDDGQPSAARLISQTLTHLMAILRGEIALAKAEARESAALIGGAIGMTIGDLLDPVYVVYAPKTFILKFCIGLIAGLIAHKIGKINEQTDQKQIFKWALLAAIGGLLFNVIFDPLIGYFYKLVLLGKPAAEVTLSWNVAATSINAVLSTIASVVIYMALRPALQKSGLFSQVKAAAK